MDCVFPPALAIEAFAESSLTDYCTGPLVSGMGQLAQGMQASLEDQYTFGADCTPRVVWQSDKAKYEVVGVELDGENKLFHTDYNGPAGQKEVCHTRMVAFDSVFGDFNVDHWFDINDEGFKAYFDNNLAFDDLNRLCQGEEWTDYFDNGHFRVFALESVVIEGVQECFKKFYFYPTEFPGIEINLLMRETGRTSALVRSERGTQASRDFP